MRSITERRALGALRAQRSSSRAPTRGRTTCGHSKIAGTGHPGRLLRGSVPGVPRRGTICKDGPMLIDTKFHPSRPALVERHIEARIVLRKGVDEEILAAKPFEQSALIQ